MKTDPPISCPREGTYHVPAPLWHAAKMIQGKPYCPDCDNAPDETEA